MSCCSKEIVNQEQIQTNTMSEIEFLLDKENNSHARFSICQTCSQLLPIVNVCKQCGCFMNIKTRIYSSKCPLEKW
jgi:hypothetical protein